MKKIFFSLIIILFGITAYDHANSARNDNILIALQPTYPGPNQEVTASLESIGVDLNRSHITWQRNGSVVLQGVGAKSYRFTSGGIGQTEILTVIVRDIHNKELRTTKEFTVGDVDILWTADTTIPPEYEGRPLPSPRSLIIITAFPRFFVGNDRVSSNSLIYEWFVNDVKISESSGAGKNIMQYRANPGENGSYKITLLASSQLKNIITEKSIFISTAAPEVLLYEEKSLEGPDMSHILANLAMRPGDKKNFRAIPYFFSKNGDASLEYSWLVNREDITQDKRSSILEFGLVKGKIGLVTIQTEVKNIKNTLQKAVNEFSINVR